MTPHRPVDGRPGEILFEFRAIGAQVRVAAIDAATGTEVVIVAPASASRIDMQRIATAKLKRRLSLEPGGGDSLESPDRV